MKVIWTDGASNDLEAIADYIRADKPDAAHRVTNTIYDAIMRLPSFPYRGRIRDEDSSLEYVLPTVPYIVLYEVIGERIFVKGIHHASQDRS